MPTRRQVLAVSVFAAGGIVAEEVHRRAAVSAEPVPGGTLDPNSIPKYVTPLFVLPVMPRSSGSGGVDRFDVAVRRFTQQILPSGPPTAVFGYGASRDSFHFPAYTIEASVNRPVRVRWSNQLVTPDGNFRPHLFSVDPTLHWANPPGGTTGRDSRPTFDATPGPYRGPVPIVTHLHGAHVTEESDGYPQAWYLPAARNIPAGYARTGSFYEQYKAEAASRFGAAWDPGTAIYQYPNDQRATALWYHSHELGLTRLNIYAGLTGLYLLRGGSSDLPAGVLPGPAPRAGDAPGTRYHEIPLVIQDRSFNTDGSLFFPTDRGFFGDVPPGGPYLPQTDVPPMWNPEFFGNAIVVNGRTWPVLQVERRRYRLRILNACNTRMLLLKIAANPLAPRPAAAALPIWAIGADGGFLPAPVSLARLPVAAAERADVIVDFSSVPVGTALYLINEGPDEPFGGGEPGTDFEPADPATTGQAMKFVVVASPDGDPSTPPAALRLPGYTALGPATTVRRVSLNEMASGFFPDAPTMGMLGTMNADGTPNPLAWGAPVTERPARGVTEVWELHNFTEDGHPIHLHQVQFQVVGRQAPGQPQRPPQAWETGDKDTVVALPGEITRLKARFDIAGRYVWHCHIIDHEDNEMMRPIIVT